MFTSENDFFHTSSLASTVRNSDFDNHFLVILMHLNHMLPQWSFYNLKLEASNSCNMSVVLAGSLMIVFFFFLLLNVSETDVHHIFNRRGSMSSVPWLYGTNVLKQINDSFYNYIAHSEIPYIETCSIEKPVN